MEPLPMVPPSCSLNSAELREQLERYRQVGQSATVLVWEPGRRAIQVAPDVPDSLVEELIEVERGCCPFFELAWDPGPRRLSLGVVERRYEPALAGLGYALGVSASS